MNCVYLGQLLGEMGWGDGTEAKLHKCECPRAIGDVAIVHPDLEKHQFEIDAHVNRDGKRLEARFLNCHACVHKSYTTEARPWRVGELKYITTAMLMHDTLRLVPHLPSDIAGVVGIPRSGLMPAALLASVLRKPLYSLDPQRGLLECGAGNCRGRTLEKAGGPVLVIDDTVYDGVAMDKARAQVGNEPAIFAAVYTRRPECVDLFAKHLPSPHLCEWNLFQNPVMSGQAEDKRLRGGICFDFDGVFCPNPSGPVTDAWLRGVPALQYLPTACEIPMIVSMRCELWRAATVDWLERHGAKCEKIVLAQYKTEAERNANFTRALIKTKAMPFAESDCWLMVESEPDEAELIADVSEKPVLCIGDGEIYYG